MRSIRAEQIACLVLDHDESVRLSIAFCLQIGEFVLWNSVRARLEQRPDQEEANERGGENVLQSN